MLIEKHKSKQIAASLENLCRYHDEGESFMESIITGDETWVHAGWSQTIHSECCFGLSA
jgi:hypothetical protein